MIQKTKLPYKINNELISNIFANLLRYDNEDIIINVFSLLKSYILLKSQLKIVKNFSILENLKLGLARFWKQKVHLGSANLLKKARLAKN